MSSLSREWRLWYGKTNMAALLETDNLKKHYRMGNTREIMELLKALNERQGKATEVPKTTFYGSGSMATAFLMRLA